MFLLHTATITVLGKGRTKCYFGKKGNKIYYDSLLEVKIKLKGKNESNKIFGPR